MRGEGLLVGAVRGEGEGIEVSEALNARTSRARRADQHQERGGAIEAWKEMFESATLNGARRRRSPTLTRHPSRFTLTCSSARASWTGLRLSRMLDSSSTYLGSTFVGLEASMKGHGADDETTLPPRAGRA